MENTEQSQTGPRRTQRQTVKPKYLQDYVLLVEKEGEKVLLCLNNEPFDFMEQKNQRSGYMLVNMKSIQ